MHHMIVINKQKNELKKQSKGNFRLASQFSWLKPYRERLGIIKGSYKRKILVREAFL